jgi:sulfate permease, SulP family
MRFAPGLSVLRGYRREWLRGDLAAGATVGAMLIPQSMAYAELAGLPPQYGFYAVVGALLVYAVVGSSRHLGVGPEPGTAILAATGVGAIAGGDPQRYVALMAALALTVSAICLAAAVVRLGFLASVLSKPVLVGYITGVGLTLISSQLGALTGTTVTGTGFFSRVGSFTAEWDEIHLPTATLGLLALSGIVALRRRHPAVPGALLAVAAATAAMALGGLEGHGIAVVGAIPAGLPAPTVPDVALADLGRLVPVAAGVALVGYTDNVLTARSIAVGRGYRIDANQELFALGLTNLSAGLSQGFPVSSSASRTAVPASLGSSTQLVSVVAASLVVLSVLVLRPVMAQIPRPALAAVIIAAGLAIIDLAGYRSLWRFSRDEFALASAAALGVMVFDVLVGVVVAVGLSVVVALGRMARPHDAVLGDVPDLDGWVDLDAYPEAVIEPGLLVYRYDAPLFFLNAGHFVARVQEVLLDNPGAEEWLILDFEGVGSLDATAVEALADLLDQLDHADLALVGVARANDVVLGRLRRAGLLAPEGALESFPTINGAVRSFRSRPPRP